MGGDSFTAEVLRTLGDDTQTARLCFQNPTNNICNSTASESISDEQTADLRMLKSKSSSCLHLKGFSSWSSQRLHASRCCCGDIIVQPVKWFTRLNLESMLWIPPFQDTISRKDTTYHLSLQYTYLRVAYSLISSEPKCFSSGLGMDNATHSKANQQRSHESSVMWFVCVCVCACAGVMVVMEMMARGASPDRVS